MYPKVGHRCNVRLVVHYHLGPIELYPLLEQRAVERERLVLSALSADVRAIHGIEACELRLHLREGASEVALLEADTGDLDKYRLEAGGDHLGEEVRLRPLPEEGEGREGERGPGAYRLDAEALVVGEDGADGDALHVGEVGLDGQEEAVQVLGLVRVCGASGGGFIAPALVNAKLRARLERLARDDLAVEGQTHCLGDEVHCVVANRLVHVRVELVCTSSAAQRLGAGETCGIRYDRIG